MKYRKIVFLTIILLLTIYINIGITENTKAYSAETLYVGGSGEGNYTLIQDAINDAWDGDTIFIYPGIYQETIFIHKQLTILGADKENTIIDGKGIGNVIKIERDYVKIQNLTIKNTSQENMENSSGISINGSFVVISNCIIQDCYLGIYVKIKENTIEYCDIKENSAGLYLRNADENIVKNCTIKNNNQFYGISLHHSNKNRISGCMIEGQDSLGMSIIESSSNEIYHNVFRNNQYGIRIFMTAENVSHGNKLYENDFINSPVIDNSNNSWDNGVHGNYWSDYQGKDNNNDSIGDIPYDIPGGLNKDNYPLMKPFNIKTPENMPPIADFTFTPSNPKTYETIQFIDESRDQDGNITAYHWDFGDGNTSNEQNPTHTYTSNGTFHVTLQVTDDKGATDEKTRNIMVIQSIISVEITQPESGENISKTVIIKGTAYSTGESIKYVEIKIDNGSWIKTEGAPNWSYNWDTTKVANGIHTIYARSFDGNQYSPIASITINVNNQADNQNNNQNNNNQIDNIKNSDEYNEKQDDSTKIILFYLIFISIIIIGSILIIVIIKIR